jgi:hypothetical protein
MVFGEGKFGYFEETRSSDTLNPFPRALPVARVVFVGMEDFHNDSSASGQRGGLLGRFVTAGLWKVGLERAFEFVGQCRAVYFIEKLVNRFSGDLLLQLTQKVLHHIFVFGIFVISQPLKAGDKTGPWALFKLIQIGCRMFGFVSHLFTSPGLPPCSNRPQNG